MKGSVTTYLLGANMLLVECFGLLLDQYFHLLLYLFRFPRVARCRNTIEFTCKHQYKSVRGRKFACAL